MRSFVVLGIMAMLLFGSMFSNLAVAQQTGSISVNYGADQNQTANDTWARFWSNLYTWIIIIPAAFLMALPWILYAVNRIKAEHEEDPQAQYKAKRWFTLAIEIDIILALVVSGVLFAWFHALANP